MDVSRVASITSSFMKDTYGISYDASSIQSMCAAALRQVYTDNPGMPVNDINKRAISMVKDLLLKRQQQKDVPESPETPAAPPGIAAEQPVSDDADAFFSKLQDLEMTRNASLAASLQRPPSEYITAAATAPVAPAPQLNTPAIVYVSSVSTKLARAFVINGIDRMWNYFHERSVVVWSGPIPALSPGDTITVALSCLCLPPSVVSPFVFVDIAGATGQNVCIPCTKSSTGSPWDTWKPVSKNVATFPPISCPWTVKLLDSRRRDLNLGKDDATVATAVKLFNGNTKVVLSRPYTSIKDHTLTFKSSTDSDITSRVLNVLGSELEVEGDLSMTSGYYVCDESAQMSLLFEVQKNESTVTPVATK